MANKLSQYLQQAMSHVGEDGSWTYRNSGLWAGAAWCVGFVIAVSNVVGGLSSIIPNNVYYVGGFVDTGVKNNMGTFIRGPWHGANVSPNPGDMIIYRFEPRSSYAGYGDYLYSDHIGIVRECRNGVVYTVEGNTSYNGRSSACGTKERSVSYSSICGYYRPYWNKVGVTATSTSTSIGTTGTSLYDHLNDKQDATLREVGYISVAGQPSIHTSGIRLSVINYTTLLNSIYVATAGSATSGGAGTIATSSANLGSLDSKAATTIQYLMKLGLNLAASIGVAANIRAESNFDTAAVGDYGTSFGICQWHNERGSAMKSRVGSNWRNNLTGQIDYLWYELNYAPQYVSSSLIQTLKSVSNSLSGARAAADAFVRQFERPASVDQESQVRQNYASSYWSAATI